MATRTVDELDGKRKREEDRDEARRELEAAMARFAAAELSSSDAGTAPGRSEERVGAGAVSLSSEASKPSRKLCCALDGTGVPALPGETAGRAGKDGSNPSGSLRAGTREAKVGVLWVSETDDEGRAHGRRRGGSVRGIESAAETPGEESPFERRLLRELAAAGCAPQDMDVCDGDGAEWIRRCSTTGSRTPTRSSTSTMRRNTCGRRRAPATTPATRPRRGRRGCAECSRRAASTTCWPTCGGAAATPRNAAGAVGYLAERRDRMRYDKHLAAGLPIGSGSSRRAARFVAHPQPVVH